MKYLNFKMVVSDANHTWIEHIEVSTTVFDTELSYAKDLITKFNKSLRPGELPRKVVVVRPIKANPSTMRIKHTWTKKSLVTEKGGV
jgi:hypothetical protein